VRRAAALRAHERHAHGARSCLVFADRDPRPAESGVAQPVRAKDGEEQERQDRPEIEAVGSSRCVDLLEGDRQAERVVQLVPEAGRVDRADAERAVCEIEAADVVAVADRLRDDLSETERHDREVVAAEP